MCAYDSGFRQDRAYHHCPKLMFTRLWVLMRSSHCCSKSFSFSPEHFVTLLKSKREIVVHWRGRSYWTTLVLPLGKRPKLKTTMSEKSPFSSNTPISTDISSSCVPSWLTATKTTRHPV